MIVDKPSRRIRILRDDVSRKIAAGEVIDRPLSIVRELLDNAIDAGAASIDVYLEGGGLTRVRVVDDGAGMEPADLALCWRAHATSKIETEDDLLRVTSLGFRGEALSSVAAASRLEIVSRPAAPDPAGESAARRIVVRGGRQIAFEPCPGRQGSAVDVTELFFNYPARKKFLRGASSESLMCRSVFVDRAIAHPAIAFRLFADGALRLAFPPMGRLERVAAAYGHQLDPRLLRESVVEGGGFTARLVAGLPELRRRDRKLLQVFVNRRRVAEFSLIQAVEHAFSGYVPGGYHPVGFVLIDIDPSLVDFNIHPAKKEVRFRALADVHAAVVAAGRQLLVAEQHVIPRPPVARPAAPELDLPGRPGRTSLPLGQPASVSSFARNDARPLPQPLSPDDGVTIRFLGQVFGVFLAFELPDRLLLLDQHAAHEKILFERFMARQPVPQEMLFPVSFDVSDEEDERLAREAAGLEELGIVLRRAGARTWEVVALSEDLQPLGEGEIVEMLREPGRSGEGWKKDLLARAACRLAIKEGDPVDPVTARELCLKALELDIPRCPHGRPVWHELSRESLYRLVDRPVDPPADQSPRRRPSRA
jgi:DNA mismatch repair protein MutL